MASFLSWVSGSGLVQGVIIGATLAFLGATLILNAVARARKTTTNGWGSIRDCGQPGNGILLRAACAKALPVANVFEEAAYWSATTDAAGRKLSGDHGYVLHFPAGQLPPNGAFWSFTVTDALRYMRGGPQGHSSIDERVELATNPDGSLDIHLLREESSAPGRNLLAAPAGTFKLVLRAYLPGPAILDGSYHVPPVARTDVK